VTTSESRPHKLAEIDLDEQSQPVNDAIFCTKRVGIKYLWVDALCIIQNSHDDHVYELAKMRHVYEPSFITLVAARSDSATTGFLKDRPPPKLSFRVPWPGSPSSKEILTVSLMRPDNVLLKVDL
jgi:hypothetical protein